jgi:predicted dienelactone hydrolase
MAKPVIRQYVDESRPNWAGSGARPVRTYIWHPTAGADGPQRVVLISHGTGGSAQDLDWLAEPLAAAGFLVAGPDHHGNNYVDGYLPEGFACGWERPRDLSFVLTRLEAEMAVTKAGAVGFSLGGYTVAALVGVRLQPDRLRAVVDGLAPDEPPPEFPDLLPAIRAKYDRQGIETILQASGTDCADPRIRAAFMICPAIAMLADEQSMAAVARPVEIRWAGADEITPALQNALRYAELIPGAHAECVGERVTHYQFVDGSEAGRHARASVAADAVAFLTEHLQ